MSHHQIQTHLHMFKLEVSHGSDRHEISLYKSESPIVMDLLEELERKTRVPKSYQQLVFKGQKLHLDPQGLLKKYGLFSGSRLMLVGDKLDPLEDAVFRRVLSVDKDINLIEKVLNELTNEFEHIQRGKLDRTLSTEYLPALHSRVCQIRKDLETFHRVINEVHIESYFANEIKQNRMQLLERIQSLIKSSDKLLKEIPSTL